jgi:hypothetical protein
MTKKATASLDPTCVELVRAGLITYRQLNEVHRLVQETGGSFEDMLVSKGYVSKDELARRVRRRAAPKKKTLRLTYSLDLVKLGMLTFKQLNECHREARASKGEKTVVDVMVSKGYVTDVQLATIPKPAEREKHKKFSSSWDLFRAGAVSLKALNECHKYVKLEAPGKSLKEALVERGVITREQLAEIERKKAAGELDAGAGSIRSPFMEKYAKELAELPADLAEHLRREHLESEGISPEADAAEAKLKEGDFEAARTFMDFTEGEEEPSKNAEAGEVELQAAKTMLGDEEEEASEGVAFQASQTMLGDADEESEGDDVELRAAKTMLGDDDAEGGEGEEESTDFRAAKTFIGEEPEEGEKGGKGAKKDGSDPDIRAARTFVDAAADEGGESEAALRAARTFMDMREEGDEKASSEAKRTFMDVSEPTAKAKKKPSPEKSDPDAKKKSFVDERAGSTFMDMDLDSGGPGGGMFGASETASGMAGPGLLVEGSGPGGKSSFQKQDTKVGEAGDGATFMDLEGGPGGKTKSSAGVKSGTEFDRVAGKSGAGSTSVGTDTSAGTS